MQRGNYSCKSSDAVKLAAIHYYVWHGPYDDTKDAFSLPYAAYQSCPSWRFWFIRRGSTQIHARAAYR